jgi:solute carrier family 6 (neurotransmitter transporter, glycine) member 5/9
LDWETFGGKAKFNLFTKSDHKHTFFHFSFPYICYKNGGAVFLIPYVLILIFIGKPFYFLEMVLGQFTSRGSMKAVQAIPLLKGEFVNFYICSSSNFFFASGVGIGQQIASGIITTYYSSIIALTLAYVIKSFSFSEGLPWSSCVDYYPTPCHSASSLAMLPNKTDNVSSSALLFFE